MGASSFPVGPMSSATAACFPDCAAASRARATPAATQLGGGHPQLPALDGIGPKGIALQHLGPGLQIGGMYGPDGLRPLQIPQLRGIPGGRPFAWSCVPMAPRKIPAGNLNQQDLIHGSLLFPKRAVLGGAAHTPSHVAEGRVRGKPDHRGDGFLWEASGSPPSG